MAESPAEPPPTWPIRYDSRRQVIWAAVISLFVVAVIAVFFIWAASQGKRPSFAGTALLAGIVGCFFPALVATVSGRIKLTPTAILRVPMIGRPWWIAFSDLQRVRAGNKSLSMEVNGRVWTLQWEQMASGRKRVRAVREMVRGWLASDFDLELPQAGVKSRSLMTAQIVYVIALIGWVISINLGQRKFVQFTRAIMPATQSAQTRIVGLSLMVTLMAGAWLGGLFGIRWLVSTLFSVDLGAANRWSYRRSAGHGFEVEPISETAGS